MRIPRNGFKARRSLSPVTIQEALPETAHSKSILSSGSRQTESRWIGGRTIVARWRNNRNRSFISDGRMANLGRIKTSASSDSNALEETSSKTPDLPAIPYLFDDMIDFSHREFFYGSSCPYSSNNLIQLRTPGFLFQLTHQLELFSHWQLFYDCRQVYRNRYFHVFPLIESPTTFIATQLYHMDSLQNSFKFSLWPTPITITDGTNPVRIDETTYASTGRVS